MKKSSLKGMMSRVIIYSITVLLSSLFCWREADAQVRAKTVCLTVTDGFSAPLYGVYVVDILAYSGGYPFSISGDIRSVPS